MNLVNTSNCDKCTGDREETQLHMFYECEYVKPLFIWILKCLSNVCNFKPSSNIKYIFSYQNIICNLFIYIYML